MAKRKTEFYLKLDREELAATFAALNCYITHTALTAKHLGKMQKENHDKMVDVMKHVHVRVHSLKSLEGRYLGQPQ